MTAKGKNFVLEQNPYYKMSKIDISKFKQEFWEVNETISELSYLTHSYFRYYGKFPSKIGRLIINDLESRHIIDSEKDFIIDNYAGSGTSLVEAKMCGFDSFGIDINPFAVLACKVKTRNYNIASLRNHWKNLQLEINAYNQEMLQPDSQELLFDRTTEDMKDRILKEVDEFKMKNKDAEKWFSPKALVGLAIIKCILLSKRADEERDFFELAFFAIIRRVSTAHDGEVRPHVNKKKRERSVSDAYSKKVSEMIELMDEWNQKTKTSVSSGAILCDNSNEEIVSCYVNHLKEKTGKQLGLVISHPPYLNCFDYIPVFKLKFMWSAGFDDIFFGYDYQQIKKMEIKSYPANSAENIANYFKHNEIIYKNVYKKLRRGGYCCIVIGDCTLQGELFEVHKTFVAMLENIGFVTDKIAYRSTSYGVGQYAYKHRADYNEDAGRKKDGVLFFKKR